MQASDYLALGAYTISYAALSLLFLTGEDGLESVISLDYFSAFFELRMTLPILVIKEIK